MKHSALLLALCCVAPLAAQSPRFDITIPASTRAGPLTGRLVLVIASKAEPEPRYAISPSGPALFAIDLEQQPAGKAAVVDDKALGYYGSLAALPPGDYFAQAVINVYEQVRPGGGKPIWIHLNDGRQEPFQVATGNLYSDVVPVTIGPGARLALTVSHTIEAQPKPADTDWVKRIQVQSQLLTRFWGRPTYVHATVLLPNGYAGSTQRYPAVYTLGHNVPFSFTPDSTRVRGLGQVNPVTGTETGYDFYKSWTSPGFPGMIAVSFEQQTPYFPDSYSVNSANNGPYGDAIVAEVIPELERRFRIQAEARARLVEGASTGGWSALNLILKHPDFFGGAWVLQPDPIDFRKNQLVNNYADSNAFAVALGAFASGERPFRRSTEGQVVWTTRQMSRFEEILGTRGRSGYQLEGWEAVYGPVGEDGYPRALWNKLTGTIDKTVAEYWKANGYDLREYAQRNWATLGPKLQGKLHLAAGDMDDFYLNLAVYQFEEFLKGTSNPKSDAEFVYGRPMKGHSWHAITWADLVRRMAASVR